MPIFKRRKAVEAFDIAALSESVKDDGVRLMNLLLAKNERSRRLFQDSNSQPREQPSYGLQLLSRTANSVDENIEQNVPKENQEQSLDVFNTTPKDEPTPRPIVQHARPLSPVEVITLSSEELSSSQQNSPRHIKHRPALSEYRSAGNNSLRRSLFNRKEGQTEKIPSIVSSTPNIKKPTFRGMFNSFLGNAISPVKITDSDNLTEVATPSPDIQVLPSISVVEEQLRQQFDVPDVPPQTTPKRSRIIQKPSSNNGSAYSNHAIAITPTKTPRKADQPLTLSQRSHRSETVKFRECSVQMEPLDIDTDTISNYRKSRIENLTINNQTDLNVVRMTETPVANIGRDVISDKERSEVVKRLRRCELSEDESDKESEAHGKASSEHSSVASRNSRKSSKSTTSQVRFQLRSPSSRSTTRITKKSTESLHVKTTTVREATETHLNEIEEEADIVTEQVNKKTAEKTSKQAESKGKKKRAQQLASESETDPEIAREMHKQSTKNRRTRAKSRTPLAVSPRVQRTRIRDSSDTSDTEENNPSDSERPLEIDEPILSEVTSKKSKSKIVNAKAIVTKKATGKNKQTINEPDEVDESEEVKPKTSNAERKLPKEIHNHKNTKKDAVEIESEPFTDQHEFEAFSEGEEDHIEDRQVPSKPKKRGRRPKRDNIEAVVTPPELPQENTEARSEAASEGEEDHIEDRQVASKPKKRGRRPKRDNAEAVVTPPELPQENTEARSKAASEGEEDHIEDRQVPSKPNKRGRRPKRDNSEAVVTAPDLSQANIEASSEAASEGKEDHIEDRQDPSKPKTRGRRPKRDNAEAVVTPSCDSASLQEQESESSGDDDLGKKDSHKETAMPPPKLPVNARKKRTYDQNRSANDSDSSLMRVVSSDLVESMRTLSKTKNPERESMRLTLPAKKPKVSHMSSSTQSYINITKTKSKKGKNETINASKKRTLFSVLDSDEDDTPDRTTSQHSQALNSRSKNAEQIAADESDHEKDAGHDSEDGNNRNKENSRPVSKKRKRIAEPSSELENNSKNDEGFESFDDVLYDPSDRGCTRPGLRVRRQMKMWWALSEKDKNLRYHRREVSVKNLIAEHNAEKKLKEKLKTGHINEVQLCPSELRLLPPSEKLKLLQATKGQLKKESQTKFKAQKTKSRKLQNKSEDEGSEVASMTSTLPSCSSLLKSLDSIAILQNGDLVPEGLRTANYEVANIENILFRDCGNGVYYGSYFSDKSQGLIKIKPGGHKERARARKFVVTFGVLIGEIEITIEGDVMNLGPTGFLSVNPDRFYELANKTDKDVVLSFSRMLEGSTNC